MSESEYVLVRKSTHTTKPRQTTEFDDSYIPSMLTMPHLLHPCNDEKDSQAGDFDHCSQEHKLLRSMLKSGVLSRITKSSRKGRRNRDHPLDPLGMTSFSNQGLGVYTFNLKTYGAIISTGAGGTTFYAISILPSATTNWSALSSLFDQYRVDSVQWSFLPLGINNGAANNQMGIGMLAIAVDADTTAAPATFDEVVQYSTCWIGPLSNAPGSNITSKPYRYKCAAPSTALSSGLGAWTDLAGAAATGSLRVVLQYAPASVQSHASITSYNVQFRAVR